MSQFSHRRCLGGLVPFFAMFMGCSGSHPATAPVSGVVLRNGSPVADAIVVFAPVGDGTASSATTDSEGKFRLSTFGEYDGARPGDYKITVTKTAKDAAPPKTVEELNQESLKMGTVEKPPRIQLVQGEIPVKYASVATTTLQFTVKPGENEEARFELTD